MIFKIAWREWPIPLTSAPKYILITGASSGIGAALAVEYAKPGVTLHLLARNSDRLREVANACRAKGADVRTATIDITDAQAMAEYMERADAATPLELVIANAGISAGFAGESNLSASSQICHSREGGNLLNKSEVDSRLRGNDKNQHSCTATKFDEVTFDAAQAVFDVNVQGVLNTIHPILPRMAARGYGQLAIMSSLASMRPLPSAPAYSASKAAVRFYGEALRGVMKRSGVRVNVICPGWIETPLTDKNDFSMPLMMSPQRAAHIIACGLRANKPRIAFPHRLYFPLWCLSCLHHLVSDWVFDAMLRKARKA